MLTPVFQLSQTEHYLNIEIRAPFAKISETEVFVDGTEFRFYSKPYYLRLSLPGAVVEDGRESAKYHSDTGIFLLTFAKTVPGERFEGLDMLTKLLAPPGQQSAKPTLIETVGQSANQEAEEEDQDEFEDFDWLIEQTPYTEDSDMVRLDSSTYGFANHRSGVFHRLQSELLDIIDLPDADNTPNDKRWTLAQKDEHKHFSEEHYLSDLYENDEITKLLNYSPVWMKQYHEVKKGCKSEDVVEFSEEEKELMRKLPRTEYALDQLTTKMTLISLVDIMFAYCYNHRTTEGENTSESGWTISKLSATLSWLQTFTSLRNVIISSYRRSLCYPLYRHWQLSNKVFKDVCQIFTIGKRQLLKCLLEIRNIMMSGDSRYILNDLYITDYCVWIQGVRENQLDSLASNLKKLKITKQDLGLDVDVLEMAAKLAIEEEAMTNELTENIEHLNIETTIKDKEGYRVRDKKKTCSRQVSGARHSSSKRQHTPDINHCEGFDIKPSENTQLSVNMRTAASSKDNGLDSDDTTSDPDDTTSDPDDTTSDPDDITSDPGDTTSDPGDTTSDSDDSESSCSGAKFDDSNIMCRSQLQKTGNHLKNINRKQKKQNEKENYDKNTRITAENKQILKDETTLNF